MRFNLQCVQERPIRQVALGSMGNNQSRHIWSTEIVSDARNTNFSVIYRSFFFSFAPVSLPMTIMVWEVLMATTKRITSTNELELWMVLYDDTCAICSYFGWRYFHFEKVMMYRCVSNQVSQCVCWKNGETIVKTDEWGCWLYIDFFLASFLDEQMLFLLNLNCSVGVDVVINGFGFLIELQFFLMWASATVYPFIRW